jgi:hypothetical protein
MMPSLSRGDPHLADRFESILEKTGVRLDRSHIRKFPLQFGQRSCERTAAQAVIDVEGNDLLIAPRKFAINPRTQAFACFVASCAGRVLEDRLYCFFTQVMGWRVRLPTHDGVQRAASCAGM